MGLKKFVVIGYSNELIDYILGETNHTIELLVVRLKTNSEHYKKFPDRIKKVYTYTELEEIEEFVNFNFREVDDFRDAQIKIERHLSRFTSNYQYKEYQYYSMYAFWANYISTNKNIIDAIVFTSVNHGDLNEELPRSIAKKNKIPVYTIDVLFENKDGGTRAGLKKENNNEYIKLSNSNKINMYESMEYNEGVILKEKSFKEYQYKYGLLKGLLVYFGKKVLMKFSRKNQVIIISGIVMNSSILNIIFSTIRYTISLLIGELIIELFLGASKKRYKEEYGYIDKLLSYSRFMRAKLYFKINATKPKEDEKFILFALHFEPEASILNRTIMQSQLVAVKMLSQVLPEGWYVYVKEHPAQFELNNSAYSYFLSSINNYRNKFFYQKIKSIKNVRLIKNDLKSNDIIKNSMGIATINGTIALEAIKFKKPAILFGPDSTILKYSNDFIKIYSYQDCLDGIEKITNGYNFEYPDIQNVFSMYVVDINYKNMKVFLDSILNDLVDES